jgi:hypothetical protein
VGSGSLIRVENWSGKISVPESASNCSLSGDEKTLYITNDMYILRVKMKMSASLCLKSNQRREGARDREEKNNTAL